MGLPYLFTCKLYILGTSMSVSLTSLSLVLHLLLMSWNADGEGSVAQTHGPVHLRNTASSLFLIREADKAICLLVAPLVPTHCVANYDDIIELRRGE